MGCRRTANRASHQDRGDLRSGRRACWQAARARRCARRARTILVLRGQEGRRLSLHGEAAWQRGGSSQMDVPQPWHEVRSARTRGWPLAEKRGDRVCWPRLATTRGPRTRDDLEGYGGRAALDTPRDCGRAAGEELLRSSGCLAKGCSDKIRRALRGCGSGDDQSSPRPRVGENRTARACHHEAARSLAPRGQPRRIPLPACSHRSA